MKKYIALMLAMLMLVGCLCACGGKDSGKTKFVVGFDAAFPPYGYQNEQGEYVGFDLSLAEEVCKRNDWELVKKPIDWNSKDSARARMRVMVKRLLKKYKYPPEGQEAALETIMTQCEMWSQNEFE